MGVIDRVQNSTLTPVLVSWSSTAISTQMMGVLVFILAQMMGVLVFLSMRAASNDGCPHLLSLSSVVLLSVAPVRFTVLSLLNYRVFAI